MTKTGYVDLGDGKLYYEVAGDGEAFVLTHAGFVDSRMWESQWDAFAKHYRVNRYDMRGYGKSSVVKAPISRRDDLYRLLKHLDVRRAHMLGCSMGGTISIDFALDHPEMVSSLIPVSATPGGFELQGPPPPNLLEMMDAAQRGDLLRTSELQVRIWVDGPFRQPQQVDPEVRKLAAEMNKIPVEKSTWAMDAQLLDPLDPPAVIRLSTLKIPTLIVAGALDHPEILRAADVMTTEIKDAEKFIIPTAAHVPNMEKPAQFNQAVLAFLKNI